MISILTGQKLCAGFALTVVSLSNANINTYSTVSHKSLWTNDGLF